MSTIAKVCPEGEKWAGRGAAPGVGKDGARDTLKLSQSGPLRVRYNGVVCLSGMLKARTVSQGLRE